MAAGIKNHNRDKYERVRRLMWIKCEACGRLVYYKDYKKLDILLTYFDSQPIFYILA